MIKVLFLVTTPGISIHQSGGAGTHIRGTIKALEQAGISVFPLVAGDLKNAMQSKVNNSKAGGVRNAIKSFIPSRVRLLLRDLRGILNDRQYKAVIQEAIDKFKPDIIYERSSYLSTVGAFLARKNSVPIFVESDGCMVEIISQDYGVFSERLGNIIERIKLRRADRIVVMSKESKKVISKKFGIEDSGRFVEKPLGVNVDDYPADSQKVNELMAAFQIEHKFVCGFIGAVSKYHGVDILIETAGMLMGDSSIIFLLVGWSEEAKRLKQIAEDRGLTNVIFVGRVDKSEVGNFYDLFDIGIIPDADETLYPIKVLEYGAFRLCPLVPDYPVFKEIIENGVNGYTFIPKNPISLATRITEIKRNNIHEKIGNAWHHSVNENFKWEKTVVGLVQSIEDVVSKRAL